MPQASRMERKLRRVKIDRKLAYKMLDVALGQRDLERGQVAYLREEINKMKAPTPSSQDQPSPIVHGKVAAQLESHTPTNVGSLNG